MSTEARNWFTPLSAVDDVLRRRWMLWDQKRQLYEGNLIPQVSAVASGLGVFFLGKPAVEVFLSQSTAPDYLISFINGDPLRAGCSLIAGLVGFGLGFDVRRVLKERSQFSIDSLTEAVREMERTAQRVWWRGEITDKIKRNVGKAVAVVVPMVAITAGMMVLEKNIFNNAALGAFCLAEVGLLRFITHKWVSLDNR